MISSGPRYTPDPAQSESYLLGPGDKVAITVFNEPNLSGEFSVSSDGVLSLPLIGDIKAQGRSTEMVAEEYAQRLSQGYLHDPKVSIEVATYRPFFIYGEVTTPGQYPYASGMSVLDAVATAGGFTPRAKRGTVFIRRKGETSEQEYKLTPNLRLMPGDTVRLGERYF